HRLPSSVLQPERGVGGTAALWLPSSGTASPYREWILETIDSLRSRKARPDLERICRMVRRRHGSDPDRTRTELEKLIQEQTVLKVSYKGSISYRNAAKVQRKSRKRSEFGGGVDTPRERTKPDHPNNNNNNNGDSAHSFTDPEEGETEPDPRAETSVGSRNKKLQPASSPGSGNGPDTEADRVWPAQTSTRRRKHQSSAPPRGGGSAAATRGHVKPLGLKEILGYLSSQERLSEEKLTRGKVKVVMEREVERGMLRRTRCGNITLPLRGMEPDEPEPSDSSADRLARSALQDKRASEPMETGEEEEEGQGEEEEEKDNDDDPRSSDEDGGLSPVAMTTEAGLAEKSGEDAGFPRELKEESPQRQREDGKGPCSAISSGSFYMIKLSPVDWTVSDVVSYFTAVGFPEQAAAFRTQEIDGKSLLLMQRNDVLTGLSIKLGPALKIYERHIKVLQKTHFEDNDCCDDAKNTLRLLC
uniref:Sterile alpha motif domain containing 1 n=1 Tax=Poecilia reticulata TaxID=8081 RepID=A0A3P9MT77_POERE